MPKSGASAARWTIRTAPTPSPGRPVRFARGKADRTGPRAPTRTRLVYAPDRRRRPGPRPAPGSHEPGSGPVPRRARGPGPDGAAPRPSAPYEPHPEGPIGPASGTSATVCSGLTVRPSRRGTVTPTAHSRPIRNDSQKRVSCSRSWKFSVPTHWVARVRPDWASVKAGATPWRSGPTLRTRIGISAGRTRNQAPGPPPADRARAPGGRGRRPYGPPTRAFSPRSHGCAG